MNRRRLTRHSVRVTALEENKFSSKTPKIEELTRAFAMDTLKKNLAEGVEPIIGLDRREKTGKTMGLSTLPFTFHAGSIRYYEENILIKNAKIVHDMEPALTQMIDEKLKLRDHYQDRDGHMHSLSTEVCKWFNGRRLELFNAFVYQFTYGTSYRGSKANKVEHYFVWIGEIKVNGKERMLLMVQFIYNKFEREKPWRARAFVELLDDVEIQNPEMVQELTVPLELPMTNKRQRRTREDLRLASERQYPERRLDIDAIPVWGEPGEEFPDEDAYLKAGAERGHMILPKTYHEPRRSERKWVSQPDTSNFVQGPYGIQLDDDDEYDPLRDVGVYFPHIVETMVKSVCKQANMYDDDRKFLEGIDFDSGEEEEDELGKLKNDFVNPSAMTQQGLAPGFVNPFI